MSEHKTHELKTDSEVFQSVIAGHKKFEIRFNDRGFKVGDWLHLLETVSTGAEMADGALLEYTGRDYLAVVTHILAGPIYGLKEGWVIMSIESASSDFSLDDDVELAILRAHLADAVAFAQKAGHLPGCGAPRCQYKEKQPGDYWLCCPRHEERHYGDQLSGHDFQPGTCSCGLDELVGEEG